MWATVEFNVLLLNQIVVKAKANLMKQVTSTAESGVLCML